jgi:hypothetical protein
LRFVSDFAFRISTFVAMFKLSSIAMLPAGLALTVQLCAEEGQQAEAGARDARARLAFMQASADEYRFRFPGSENRQITRLADPILRWDNQVVREDDAGLFLWVDGARPVCGAQLFLQGDAWHHEFQSLSADPFQVSWRQDAWTWSCKKPGLSLAAADLDPPADKPAQRLRQMRSFAQRFTAATDPSRGGNWQDPHQLRLLPTPVYRYANESEVLDGALFAFVQGTNPEVLLLIEASASEGADRWQYGFAPMTSFEVRVERDGTTVWQQDVQPVPTRDLQGPYQFRWKAVPRSDSQ